jgi:hypothetical protein
MRSLLPCSTASTTKRRNAPSCGERPNASLTIMQSTVARISSRLGASSTGLPSAVMAGPSHCGRGNARPRSSKAVPDDLDRAIGRFSCGAYPGTALTQIKTDDQKRWAEMSPFFDR